MFPVSTVSPLMMRGGGATESTVAGYTGPQGKKKPTTSASPNKSDVSSSATASRPPAPQQPPSPRPTITIYTTLDENEDEETDKVLLPSPHLADVNPTSATSVSPSSMHALQSTATDLSPEHHIALYGNGLAAPEDPNVVARSLVRSREGSFFADPCEGCTPLSTLDPTTGKQFATFAEDSPPPTGSLGSAPRYSATPIVPLHAGADIHFRREAALHFRHRIEKAEAETAAASAQAEAERKAKAAAAKALEEAEAARVIQEAAKLSKKERAKKEKKDKKDKKEHKSTTGEPLAAPPAQQLTGKALKEYLVRVGIERINQRASDFHLQLHRVRNDGNCQFRAISHQLFGSESYHEVVRSHVVSYMRSVRAEQFDFFFETPTDADNYFARVSEPGAWGDELTLRGASDSLYINIHILSSEAKNCFITYRPSESAPPPPSFLVDVTTLRERRQRERGLRSTLPSRMPSRVPSTLGFHGEGNGASRMAPPPETAEDEDMPIDSAAIQHALEKRLQGAAIMSATPCVSASNSLAASFARPAPLAAPPAPPPPIPTSGPTDRIALPANGDAPSDLDKFAKAGATMQARHFGSEKLSLVVTKPDKAALIPPRLESRPEPLLRPVLPTTASPLLNSTSSFDPHPVFPTTETGNVLLVAAPRPRRSMDRTGLSSSGYDAPPSFNSTFTAPGPGRSLLDVRSPPPEDTYPSPSCLDAVPPSSYPNRSPDASMSLMNASSPSLSQPHEAEVGVCFAFEKRTEPLDIFLSYLYPVHYNSIELTETSFASPVTAQAPGELPSTSNATPQPDNDDTTSFGLAAVITTPNGSPLTQSTRSVQPFSSAASNSTEATGTRVSPVVPTQRFVAVPFLKPHQVSPRS